MTCRHSAGDPSCSSSSYNIGRREAEYAETLRNKEAKKALELTHREEVKGLKNKIAHLESILASPDATRYEVIEVEPVGTSLVLKVRYSSCERCSFEGDKIMVFENTSTIDALKWKKIDPHFSDPNEKRNFNEAPSPVARFPANTNGWDHAIKFAKTLSC